MVVDALLETTPKITAKHIGAITRQQHNLGHHGGEGMRRKGAHEWFIENDGSG